MKSTVIVVPFLLLCVSSAYSFQGWSVQDAGTLEYLTSVRAVSASVVWTCGNGGGVFRSIDGGTSWTNVSGGSLGPYGGDAIEALGIDTAFVCVNDDTAFVYRTTDGGMHWQTVIVQPGGFINAVRMTDPLNGIALGDPTGGRWVVFRTTDGGSTWNRIPTEPSQIGSEFGWVNSLHVFGTTHIWFGTSDHRVYRSTDWGNNWQWTVINSDDGYGVCFNGNTYGVVAGGNGAFRTTDGGETWQSTPLTEPQYAAASSGDLDFWMACGERVHRSTDRGLTWELSYENAGAFYWHLSFVTVGGMTYGWAVGDSGAIAHYDSLVTSVATAATSGIPGYRLWQNSPNPANPATTIRFQTGKTGHVALKVFDVLGREVATLVDEQLSPGVFSRVWNTVEQPSGVYFYRLQTRDFAEVKKIMVLK